MRIKHKDAESTGGAAKRTLRGRGVAAALCGLALASSSPAGTKFTDLRYIKPVIGNAAAGEHEAAICFGCHGAHGAPVAPLFPRLAGQRADYLYHRLLSFRHADPKDPYYSKSPMTPVAAKLSDAEMRNLAAYFAAQRPAPSNAGGAEPTATRGEVLFLHGDPARGIPPCQGCHGPDANGTQMIGRQYLAYPSLRGQPAPYLTMRLTSYRAGLPADSSNTFIMADVAHSLDDESIQALAAWLSSLNPANGS